MVYFSSVFISLSWKERGPPELRVVPRPAITEDGDDSLLAIPWLTLFRYPASCYEVHRARRAQEEAIMLDEMPAHDDRFQIGHLDRVVDKMQALLQVCRYAIDPDALYDRVHLVPPASSLGFCGRVQHAVFHFVVETTTLWVC